MLYCNYSRSCKGNYNVSKKRNYKKEQKVVDKVDKVCYSIKCKVNKQKT